MDSVTLLKRFQVRKYGFLKDSTALDWASLLAVRLHLRFSLDYVVYMTKVAAREPDFRTPTGLSPQKAREYAANGIISCKEYADAILTEPRSQSTSDLKHWSSVTNRRRLVFGPVASLSVGAAHEIARSLNKLAPQYREAMNREEDCRRVPTDDALLDTPLVCARKDIPPPPMRCAVIDMVASDDEILSALAGWLKQARSADLRQTTVRVPGADVRRRWFTQRLLPYVDLTLCAETAGCPLSQTQIHRALLGDLDKSADTVRKTMKANAKELLDPRTLPALVREAERNGEEIPPDDHRTIVFPERMSGSFRDFLA